MIRRGFACGVSVSICPLYLRIEREFCHGLISPQTFVNPWQWFSALPRVYEFCRLGRLLQVGELWLLIWLPPSSAAQAC